MLLLLVWAILVVPVAYLKPEKRQAMDDELMMMKSFSLKLKAMDDELMMMNVKSFSFKISLHRKERSLLSIAINPDEITEFWKEMLMMNMKSFSLNLKKIINNMCTIQEFIDGNNEYRSQNEEKILQAFILLFLLAPSGVILCMHRKERSEFVIAINTDVTTESRKEMLIKWTLRMLRMLALNGLFTSALGLLYSYLLNRSQNEEKLLQASTLLFLLAPSGVILCELRKERSEFDIVINRYVTTESRKEMLIQWTLRMLRMLELNGLFTAALGLLYSYLLNKDLPLFVSFTRNFWNRVLNSLFNSVSVFWLPQMERNFGVSWTTGKRDKYFVFGNAIYGMVVVFTCLNVGLDIERWSMFSDSSMVIRLLLLVLIYKHVWEIIKVSIICGSGFPSCQIPPDSTHRETQITGNNGSFARMHCKGGSMDDSFEVGRAVALHQNPVSSHSNLFNVEDSKQNKEVKMFDPQSLLKLANDIESNPGPPYMCTIQEFLDGNHEYRSQNKEQLLQAVSKLDKDAKDGKIQACMYTEQNLITLYNIFDVSIREKYPQKIMTEIENLSNHWNKEVRQEELRLRSERKERSELVIDINHDETTESNKERENAHNNTEQQVLQGQRIGQREPKDGTRKGKQYKLKTSSVKKNRLHRGDWNPYGPKKNLELPGCGDPPI